MCAEAVGAQRKRWKLSDNAYKPGTSTYPGNHFCDTSLLVPMKPAWPRPKAKAPPYTTVRIVPGFSPEDPTQPDVTRLDDGELGEFIRCYPAFRAGGIKPITFLVGNKQANPDFDIWATPAKILYNAVHRAVEKNQERPEWEHLLKRHKDEEGNMRGAIVVPIKDMYFVQCVVYQHGETEIDPSVPIGLGDDERTNKLALLDLGNQAGRALVDMLRAQHETNDGFAYTLIDPIGLDSKYAKFFTFYDLSIGPPQVASAPSQRGNGPRRSAAPQPQPQGQGSTGIGYGITCFNEFGNESPAYGEGDRETIMSRMQPWEDALQFPTIERQAELLRGVIPWDVLEYAWQDHPEWLPQDCPEAEKARAKTVSGYTPPTGDDDEGVPSTGTLGRRQSRSAEADTEVPPRGRRAAPPALDDDEEAPVTTTRTRVRETAADTPAAAPRRTRRDAETDSTMRGREIPAAPDGELAPPRERARARETQAAAALQRARARM